jgi:DNA-binding transcriptional regulator LsrR (DeoR family)
MKRFGLAEARVVAAPPDAVALPRVAHDAALRTTGSNDADVAAAVGRAAGHFLREHLQDGLSVGIGWGATLDALFDTLGAPAPLHVSVVSLLGGMTHSRAVNPAAVARRLADALRADCYQLTAPLVVASEATRDALWTERGLRELHRRARKVDLALVSVGDISAEATLFREGLVPRAELAGLRAAGAVGDVLCRFVDAHGQAVDHPLNRRVVAIGLEDLRRVPRIVVVSGGARKVAALRAALSALPVSVLITDAAAASGLLAGDPSSAGGGPSVGASSA